MSPYYDEDVAVTLAVDVRYVGTETVIAEFPIFDGTLTASYPHPHPHLLPLLRLRLLRLLLLPPTPLPTPTPTLSRRRRLFPIRTVMGF